MLKTAFFSDHIAKQLANDWWPRGNKNNACAVVEINSHLPVELYASVYSDVCSGAAYNNSIDFLSG